MKPLTSALTFGLVALLLLFTFTVHSPAVADKSASGDAEEELSLITDTPEEGLQVAIELARRGVTATQPDRDVLHSLRPAYSTDAAALIAASHVVAVHFRTVAEANAYWR